MGRNRADLILGLGAVGLAVLAIVAWVPNDSATGLIVQKRGRLSIGDALAPMAALGLIAVSGALIAARKPGEKAARPTLANLRFLLVLTAIFAASLALMRWSGPIAVGLAQAAGLAEHSYRELRDTVPWKYTGFVLGGTGLVASLMSLAERRFSWRALGIGLLAVAGLIAVFDLPFPDLLLPPNGDL
ncbi:MAG: hypothetical protein VXW58_14530 [Pseudomonadota bacterium]|nr:hypothetical protein [Pseudomonadota bacterium]